MQMQAIASKEQITQHLVRMTEQIATLEASRENTVSRSGSEKKQLIEEREALAAKLEALATATQQAKHAGTVTAHLEAQLRQVWFDYAENYEKLRLIA
jgi:chromosome segregation ATPase